MSLIYFSAKPLIMYNIFYIAIAYTHVYLCALFFSSKREANAR